MRIKWIDFCKAFRTVLDTELNSISINYYFPYITSFMGLLPCIFSSCFPAPTVMGREGGKAQYLKEWYSLRIGHKLIITNRSRIANQLTSTRPGASRVLNLSLPVRGAEEGNGNPLQCSCLENPIDRGAWWAIVHGVTKSWTRLSEFHFQCFFFFFLKYGLQRSGIRWAGKSLVWKGESLLSILSLG